jgi:hypothetical protein
MLAGRQKLEQGDGSHPSSRPQKSRGFSEIWSLIQGGERGGAPDISATSQAALLPNNSSVSRSASGMPDGHVQGLSAGQQHRFHGPEHSFPNQAHVHAVGTQVHRQEASPGRAREPRAGGYPVGQPVEGCGAMEGVGDHASLHDSAAPRSEGKPRYQGGIPAVHAAGFERPTDSVGRDRQRQPKRDSVLQTLQAMVGGLWGGPRGHGQGPYPERLTSVEVPQMHSNPLAGPYGNAPGESPVRFACARDVCACLLASVRAHARACVCACVWVWGGGEEVSERMFVCTC